MSNPFVFLFYVVGLALVQSRDVKLAVLLPWSGELGFGDKFGNTIQLAISSINNNNTILPDNNLTYVLKDTKNDPGIGLQAVADLWRFENPFVDVFIGPGMNEVCKPTELLAKQWNIPVISWGCSKSGADNSNHYSTLSRIKAFGRTNPVNSSSALRSILKHFGWKTVVLIHSLEDAWRHLAKTISEDLHRREVTVALEFPFSTVNNYGEFLNKAREKTRVFVLLCYAMQVGEIMQAARNHGLANGNYAFVTVDLDFDVPHGDVTHGDVTLVQQFRRNGTLDGLIEIAVSPVLQSAKFTDLERRAHGGAGRGFKLSPYAAYVHDAITLYAYALHDTITQGGNITDGLNITRNVRGKSFEGMSGKVVMDGQGGRIPFYALRNVQNGSLVEIATINSSSLEFNVNASLRWPGGAAMTPRDVSQPVTKNPPSGGEAVEVYISVPLVILFVVCGGFIGMFLYKRYNRIRDVSSMIIKYEDIELSGIVGGTNSRRTFSFRSQGVSAVSDRSSLLIPAQRYALVGRYKNRPVFVKKIRRRSVSLNEEIVRELYEVHKLSHVNINPYIGVCITAPNICIVSEACGRGSLADVLINDDIKLDWTFKMSFATDIAAGMEALHASEVSFHGNLTSSNCLVDRMWVCKIADYGLQRFSKHTYEPEEQLTGQTAKLWMAPEHMRNASSTGSQPGDVYSFGVILSEIVTRCEPFETLRATTSVHEILRRIMSTEFPPLRPTLNADDCDPTITKFIKQCWSEEPSARPTFRDIKKSMRKINGGRSLRLVDSMLGKMDIYSNNLEVLVEERTRQLEAEKAKTDQLLYEMLPRPVADQLKSGKSVEAELFDQVTVFFSDIVGFTKLSSSSTPIQVVTFLNDLYTYFDNIIPNYDVYKVETIGDAYMVVSGLPEKNRDRHAGEIATMALHLLCDIRTFKIRHVPDTSPKLRVGIHTGPAVAGVVGIKKPRYDVFGDTVNVASRMESNGVPNRIHISAECRKALLNLGGYHMERRGEIELKGKGKVITYFLNGKDGFNRVRPEPSN